MKMSLFSSTCNSRGRYFSYQIKLFLPSALAWGRATKTPGATSSGAQAPMAQTCLKLMAMKRRAEQDALWEELMAGMHVH